MKDLIYNALMLGRNKKLAREEFLVYSGEKEPASFSVPETELLYEDVLNDVNASILVHMENEGYEEISIECGDPFIKLENHYASTDESKDGNVEIPFTIVASRLHNGKNFAKINLSTFRQSIDVFVTVNNRISVKAKKVNPKKIFADITNGYLLFRMGRITQKTWTEETLRSLEIINGNGPEDLFLMLYKAHISKIADQSGEAGNLIEYVSGQIHSRKNCPEELRAYFMYVKSIYEMDEDQTRKALDYIRELYDREPSWHLLWMMFYLDEGSQRDVQGKLSKIKFVFEYMGCKSPVMYFEALEVLRSRPELITGVDRFELQVLNFAAKRGIADTGCIIRIAELITEAEDVSRFMENYDLIMKILKGGFEEHQVTTINNAIVRLLIAAKDGAVKNHRYFERAVFDYHSLSGLFEYYIFSTDTREKSVIPERILNTFSIETSTLGEWRAYFYANVIENRYKSRTYKRTYEAIENDIKSYASGEGYKIKNNEFLSVVYGEALQNSGKDIFLKQVIFNSMIVRRIVCRNSAMETVLVFHKEMNSYQSEALTKDQYGQISAYIKIYSPNYLILFRDASGNVYINVDHEIVEFKNYSAACIKDIPVNHVMLLGENLETALETKSPFEIMDYVKKQLGKGPFNKDYEQELIYSLICRYKEQDNVYENLLGFLDCDITPVSRGKLVELMIEKKQYSEAKKEIEKNGFAEMNPELLSQLAHVYAQLESDEKNELLCSICEYCISAEVKDPELLRYLCKYYEGPLDRLLEIHKKSRESSVDNLQLSERILRTAMETGDERKELFKIFEKCYRESRDRDLIKDFMEYCAAGYLYGRRICAAGIFSYMAKDLHRGAEFSDPAKCGFLLFMKDADIDDEKDKRLIQNILNELVYRGIMFEEFKALQGTVRLPAPLSNAYIVSYINKSETKTMKMDYILREPRRSYEKETEMRQLFPGIYVKYFYLLYGQRITYNVSENESVTVGYEDIEYISDDSRSDMADRLLRLKKLGNPDFDRELEKYFVKDRLMEKLF